MVSTAGGIGSFGFPFVMSAVAHGSGVRMGFLFFVALCAAMTGAAAGVLKLTRQAHAGSQT